MNAKEFFFEFKNNVNIDTIDMNIYKDSSAFTKTVNNDKIPKIIEKYGYTPQNEYYRIDTVGWVSRYKEVESKAQAVGLKPHLWDLKIAVEHENSNTDWTDEVIKLIHIRCPLKVVIGYNHCDKRGKEEQEKLEFISYCMNLVEAFEPSNEEFLIILGNCYSFETRQADYTDFGYKGYLYDKSTKKFVELKEE